MNTFKCGSIEEYRYQQFLVGFQTGQYGGQRLGQAFYNEFHLHRITDQAALKNLYEMDGVLARELIRELFNFQ